MPVKKKSDVTAPPTTGAKPAAKKSVSAGSKPAGAKKAEANPATAAATHKAPARRATAKNTAAPVFDVELHRAEIEREAYLLWVGRGHEHGQEQQDWLAAIELVKARHQG